MHGRSRSTVSHVVVASSFAASMAIGLGGGAGCQPSAPAASAADIAHAQADLSRRFEGCRSGAQPTARCLAAAPKLAGEPDYCATMVTEAVHSTSPEGRTVTMLPGSWSSTPVWRLVRKDLLDPLPAMELGGEKSRPVASLAPKEDDAAPPRAGDFVRAFEAVKFDASKATEAELASATQVVRSYLTTVEARLDARNVAGATAWPTYSRACFADMVATADIIKGDLMASAKSLNDVVGKREVDAWLEAAGNKCKVEFTAAGCATAPSYATQADKDKCSAACKSVLVAAKDDVYQKGVKACADQFATSDAPKTECIFIAPPKADFKMDDVASQCASDCGKLGKQLLAEAEDRRKAAAEGQFLVISFRSCMRGGEKDPATAKYLDSAPLRYRRIMNRKDAECRALSRCDWLERYSERQCKYKDFGVHGPEGEQLKAEAAKAAGATAAAGGAGPKADAAVAKGDGTKGDGTKGDGTKGDASKVGAASSTKGDAPKMDGTPVKGGFKGDAEAGKADAPKGDAPKADTPKADAPKADGPKSDGPAPAKPKVDTSVLK